MVIFNFLKIMKEILSIFTIKPYLISNFGLRKINNIDNISYTFKKLKY